MMPESQGWLCRETFLRDVTFFWMNLGWEQVKRCSHGVLRGCFPKMSVHIVPYIPVCVMIGRLQRSALSVLGNVCVCVCVHVASKCNEGSSSCSDLQPSICQFFLTQHTDLWLQTADRLTHEKDESTADNVPYKNIQNSLLKPKLKS